MAEAARRVCFFGERRVVRFFARAAPARLVVVRRVVDFPRAVRLFVRDAAAPRDFVVLAFLPARDFVPCLLAMDNLRGGRIEIGKSP